MKAVIVEIRDDYVAVLSNDGRITKMKNDNYMIGQVIEMKEQSINKGRFIKIAAAAVASIMLFVVPAWAYLTPYSYVSLDVNPSVEYTVNIFDRVLSVKAVNDDGEEILKQINIDDLKNKNIEVAVQEVVNGIIEAGFFEKGEEGGIIIAASSKNDEKAQKLADKLKSKVEEKIKEDSAESEVEVEAIGVGEKRVQEAKELGVTPGKLNLVEKLQQSAENPDDILIEEWLNRSVKEIMNATKENKKVEKEENKESKEENIEENKEENKEENIESKEENKEQNKEENIESKEENKESNEEKIKSKEEKTLGKEIETEKEDKDKGNIEKGKEN